MTQQINMQLVRQHQAVSKPVDETQLIDPFGRRITYLRVSVTDRCNLHCTYCMPVGKPEWFERESLLTFEDIERIVRAAAKLGIRKVRITGGEPLVRENLPRLAADVLRGRPMLAVAWQSAPDGLTHTFRLRQGVRWHDGKPFTSADVQSPTIVSRGETVWVDVATGSLLVKAKAKSLGTARDGQLVQLQIEGSKKPITARMAGRGRAVMELAPSPDQDPAPTVPSLSRSKP